MLQQLFSDFISSRKMFEIDDEIMLAVSGGVDSVVMADLFYALGTNCIILHCNFGLRGTESDGDEAFVRSLAARYEWPVYVEKFETLNFAEDHGISVQMAARELRYTWFNEMAERYHCNFIATAHNKNDSVETMLLNLSRGTGLKGLTGIPVINGTFIRPLLFASRQDIMAYAEQHRLAYREDSSNASKKYHRNKIRHDIIPLFEEINPSFISVMNENARHISEAYQIFNAYVEETKSRIFAVHDTHIEMEIDLLKELAPLSTWLYEIFSDFGFSREQCMGIAQLLDSASGKQCISTTHRLYKDRDKLMIYRSENSSFERYYIDSPDSRASLPLPMDIEVLDADRINEFPDSPTIAMLDLDLLDFPLTLRKWQEGDYFFPLGMDQMKKLSDFFIDTKTPVPLKKRTWILASGRKIVWVMGMRIDDRFKVTASTSQVLRMEIYPS